MSHELKTHRIDGKYNWVNICVMDDPGPAGASRHYRIEPIANDHPQGAINSAELIFQSRAPNDELGADGITNEALLCVVIDRLEGFQSGPFSCMENDYAIGNLREALQWLMGRSRDRSARGVEGKPIP